MTSNKGTNKGLTTAQKADADALVKAIGGVGAVFTTLVGKHWLVGAAFNAGVKNGSWVDHRDAGAIIKRAGWDVALGATTLYHDGIFATRFSSAKAAETAYAATWKVSVTDFVRGNSDGAKAAAKKAATKKAAKITAADKKELSLFIQSAAFKALSPAAKAAVKAIVA
jgi:hypothetical protein